MDFNKTSDNSGLIQLCEDLCKMGRTGISGNTPLLQQFTSYINMGLGVVWHNILQVNKNAKQDDYNYTTIPDAPITTVADQQDYTIPVASTGANVNTLQRINGIYYEVDNERVYLRPMDNDEALSGNSGFPTAYRIQGKSIFFDRPLSSEFVAAHSVFHVEFQRIPSYFVSGDTTKQAGFLAIHHPLLAIYASAMFMKPIDPSLSRQYSSGRDDIPGDFESGIQRLKLDYAKIDDNFDNRMTMRSARSGR